MPISCILLDIEGTVSPLAFVQEALFPYARRELPAFLRRTPWAPAVVEALDQMARDAGAANFESWGPRPAGMSGPDWASDRAGALMDADAKTTGLKALQGLVWEAGYADGALLAPIFEDVPAALRRWRAGGLEVRIYSSGSVQAQRLFFGHTTAGDLSGFISGWHDTTVGGKREAASYRTIARAAGREPSSILFLSDVGEELKAAAEAGVRAALAVRPGNRKTDAAGFPCVTDFAQVDANWALVGA